MRWIRRTIFLFLCALFLCATTHCYASVTLKISAKNPSSLGAREIPLKSYLPKGIMPEDVISAGGLEIGYDVKRDQCYVHKDLMLDPQESAVYDVEIEDIWLITDEEVNDIEGTVEDLLEDLQETQYAQVAVEAQESIQKKIDGILRRQEDALVFKVGPTEHIAVYELNRETLAIIEDHINDLDRLVSAVEEERATGGNFDQTRAAQLLEAQRIKEQILHYGAPEVPTSCLVEESLENEKEDIVFELPETVSMKINVENPSTSKAQSIPLRYFLAKEIRSGDVVDAQGLKVGYDFGKGLYYVYDDNVTLAPDETKEFDVTLSNKWAIDKYKLYGLKVYLENLTWAAQDKIGLETAEKFGKESLAQIYKLLVQSSAAELSESYVVSYRNDVLKVEGLRRNVQRMEDFLAEANISPELTVMEQEQICQEAMLADRGAKDVLGLSGILSVRRIKLLAGTIFKGRNLSTADTWKIIWYIILFLGVVSGVFYFVNIRQQKSVMFDPLTGAFSRAYALDRFREELRVAKGGGKRCSLLVLDVDKFKGINDTHGHAAGDLILKEFVLAVRKGIRATDILGRFGGDEFMIVLPTGEKEIALKIAQSLTRIVEGTAIKVNPQLSLNITTSVGVATFPDDSGTAEDLFDKADQALYQIKRKGGNGAAAFGMNA